MRFFAIEELFGQRHIPSTDFLCRRRMTAGEVERAIVVLQKERLKMRQRVLFAEQAPDTVLEVGMAIVKLDSLHFAKLLNQGFIDDELIELMLQLRWWDKSIEEIESLMPILSCGNLEKVKAELKARL